MFTTNEIFELLNRAYKEGYRDCEDGNLKCFEGGGTALDFENMVADRKPKKYLYFDETHRADQDPSNFILQALRTINICEKGKATGEIRQEWANIGFYSSAKGAMQAYVNKGFDTCNTYQDLLDRMAVLEAIVKAGK